MLKLSNGKKKLILLLALSASTFIFIGCNNSNAPKEENKPSTEANSNSGKNRKFNTEDMKKRVQDTIKPLVDDKTLTQEQSDKVVAALSTRPNKDSNNQNKQNKQNHNTDSTNNGNKSSSTNDNNNQNPNPQRNFSNSALNKLVTDGVITQAQADAVTAKMKDSLKKANP